ncbi:DUF2141 domain-containing protein [Sphingobacteriales bacterium UPWRP_1]|nr:hypothetical protein B6N25_04285 [Sphingobacteriales bacterium TSM_CSS]PSJ75770.1 DUF2141 domain-containing protein [Sphingobacteriales bacterium UPWRP_1]
MTTFFAGLLLLNLLTLPTATPETKPLTITVQQLTNTTATIYIAVYNKAEGFGQNTAIYRGAQVTPNGKNSATAVIPDLAYGTYAVALFQDVNGNGKLDTGFFGIPKEPYGFSNNFKPVFSGPTFEKCRFNYSEQNALVVISLIQ